MTEPVEPTEVPAEPTEVPAEPTEVPADAVAVPVPIRRLDPFIGLSTAVHAAAGVYALLLGSGISTAASIFTGWQIVTDLVRKAAAAQDPTAEIPAEGFDPEAWWIEHGDGKPLGYSSLLNSLAPTAAGRDQILRTYFEASEEDRAEGRKLPTAAHEAIADLVARGVIKVIVTTNFDRLLERALEARGIQAQVVHRSDQITGMTPLPHRDATIIKLHGDYADLDKRNTVDELSEYPAEQDALLARILDEYGLIICGWSGEWDVALVRAIEQAKSRRYPIFWSSYQLPSEPARQLITQIGAVRIDNTGADELFTGLRDRLDALDRLASPPLSRDMAVARLKRYLPDPAHRIETHDLVMDEVKRVEALIGDRERYPVAVVAGISNDDFWELYDDWVRQYRADVDTLLHLLANGTYFAGPEHNPLWTRVVQRLMSAPKGVPQQYNGRLFNLTQYPTLLAVSTVLTVSSVVERSDLVLPAMIRPRLKLIGRQAEQPPAFVAHPWRVFENDAANSLPRWAENKTRWLYPESKLLRGELDDVVAPFEPDIERRKAAFDRAEYLLGLAQVSSGDTPFMGEYVLRGQYRDGPLEVAVEGRSRVLEDGGPLLVDLFDGDVEIATKALDRLEGEIQRAVSRAPFR
ncbi:SIR2-like domain-containing protein [Frankineae bacterium MT45]|nr:SIR2-like domain-containing protein [Frankineae bacterium MT45]